MTGSQPVVLNRFTISAGRDMIATKAFVGKMVCRMKKRRIAVYLRKWDEGMLTKQVYVPEERKRQLLSMRNPYRKKEMEAVWILLSDAFELEGRPLEDVHPRLLPSGQWAGEGASFSLTHEGGYVAVAIASFPVGIDLVLNGDQRLSKRLRESISTAEERNSNWTTASLFAAKEALFKRDGGTGFIPSSIHVFREKDRLFTKEIGDLTLALASSEPFEDIEVELRIA